MHCTAGLGRAPLTVLTYLICIAGQEPEDAIGLIRRARPGAVPAWEAYHGCRADLIARHRARIAHRAYALYQARSGARGDAEADWLQAEREILRACLEAHHQSEAAPS